MTEAVFQYMRAQGVEPDRAAYVVLLDAFTKVCIRELLFGGRLLSLTYVSTLPELLSCTVRWSICIYASLPM